MASLAGSNLGSGPGGWSFVGCYDGSAIENTPPTVTADSVDACIAATEMAGVPFLWALRSGSNVKCWAGKDSRVEVNVSGFTPAPKCAVTSGEPHTWTPSQGRSIVGAPDASGHSGVAGYWNPSALYGGTTTPSSPEMMPNRGALMVTGDGDTDAYLSSVSSMQFYAEQYHQALTALASPLVQGNPQQQAHMQSLAKQLNQLLQNMASQLMQDIKEGQADCSVSAGALQNDITQLQGQFKMLQQQNLQIDDLHASIQGKQSQLSGYNLLYNIFTAALGIGVVGSLLMAL